MSFPTVLKVDVLRDTRPIDHGRRKGGSHVAMCAHETGGSNVHANLEDSGTQVSSANSILLLVARVTILFILYISRYIQGKLQTMFYSTEVLRNNRSSLGMIWSAAWGRRLARSRVLNINIDQTWYVYL